MVRQNKMENTMSRLLTLSFLFAMPLLIQANNISSIGGENNSAPLWQWDESHLHSGFKPGDKALSHLGTYSDKTASKFNAIKFNESQKTNNEKLKKLRERLKKLRESIEIEKKVLKIIKSLKSSRTNALKLKETLKYKSKLFKNLNFSISYWNPPQDIDYSMKIIEASQEYNWKILNIDPTKR